MVLGVGRRRRRRALGAGSRARGSSHARRWHERFSRFEPDSELSRLNDDPRREVPASPLLVRLAAAVRMAGELSGGLVDATLVEQIEAAGYAQDLGESLQPSVALALAPPRRPAGASSTAGWREVKADLRAGAVTRPPGVKLDSGGLAKGLFADIVAARLARHRCFAVACAGDLAFGGAAGLLRPVHVESPFDRSALHTFELTRGYVATSGITRRSWLDRDGHAAHHLLDPATGQPAFTGIVQVTALAPSALEAEVRAKSALLAGPRGARLQLPHGGVLVFDDGSHEILAPPPVVTLDQLAPPVALPAL
jgi:FAD:protein FMN transferase